MKKEYFLIGFALIVVGLLIWLGMKSSPITPNVVENTPGVATSTTIKILPLVTDNSNTKYTEIKLSYPNSSRTSYSEVWSAVKKAKDEFLKEYGKITDEEAAAMYISASDPYQLYMETKIATSSKTVSYLLQTYQYTGGAHGITFYQTFTYDEKGKIIILDRLLQGNYLEKISVLSKDYFTRTLGDMSQEYMIEEGTRPEQGNFSSWYITDTHIVFIFGHYQVAPYAAGILEFPIPKTELEEFLNPEFK